MHRNSLVTRIRSCDSIANILPAHNAVRKELLDAISSVEGHNKVVFIEKSLIGVVGLIAEFSALKVQCKLSVDMATLARDISIILRALHQFIIA